MNAELLQLLFSGLALGAAYALIALGFVVIYQSSQVFNFAHGEFLTVGGFSMLTMLSWGLPWPLACLGGGVAGALTRRGLSAGSAGSCARSGSAAPISRSSSTASSTSPKR